MQLQCSNCLVFFLLKDLYFLLNKNCISSCEKIWTLNLTCIFIYLWLYSNFLFIYFFFWLHIHVIFTFGLKRLSNSYNEICDIIYRSVLLFYTFSIYTFFYYHFLKNLQGKGQLFPSFTLFWMRSFNYMKIPASYLL